MRSDARSRVLLLLLGGTPLLASFALSSAAVAQSGVASSEPRRVFQFEDLARLREVRDLQVSPEGDWVAYEVRTAQLEEDRIAGDLWMTSWDGVRSVQLTRSKASESRPRWSPDGRSLAFLADRGEGKDPKTQVWLLDRAGGEARKLTEMPGGVQDFAWSPDSQRLALIASDPDLEEVAAQGEPKKDAKKTPKPIVIDRYQFKQDGSGYLRHLRAHLYVFDVATGKAELLTAGDFDEALPSWSPDGTQIAFSSKRGDDPDRHENWDLYVIEARAGATARQLTRFEGADNDPAWDSPAVWSPDGRQIAYLQGGPPKYRDYDPSQLAVIPAAGGEPRLVSPSLDRVVRAPAWSSDGRSLYFLLEDDRSQILARVPAGGGPVERLTPASGVTRAFALGPKGRIVVLETRAQEPAEAMALEGSALRPLSTQNRALLDELRLGAVEGLEFRSADGTEVHGLLVKPPDFQPGRRYPTVAYIHGGPVSQDGCEFDEIAQTLAAHGYLVVAVNYRGSSGRGRDYSRALYADWGRLEVQDILAAVDRLVRLGLADPERLGIGGWSYGAITTNYTIASDGRFKAALSGAGSSNALMGYGTDQYIRQYESELGLPWNGVDTYLKLSYPFLHADRIRTPTLFLCGEKDFNVPLIHSEQMYQALRSLGVPTQLVIYPGQYHGLDKPSYQRDRLERYVAWLDRYLKLEEPAAAAKDTRSIQSVGGD